MAWPQTRKAETRERILGAAAAALRTSGLDAVGVAGLMDRAGLTHGGFYAHFGSKDDLLAEALRYASGETTRAFVRCADGACPDERLAAVIDQYLSASHMKHPERGCTIATLGPEAARGSANVRRTIGGSIRARLARLRDLAPRPLSARSRDQQAAGVFACMVGGMILARGLGGEAGERLLDDCRAFLKSAVESD